jgi:putative GTP pyrophosphokinase
MNRDEFFSKNRISQDVWEQSGLEWAELIRITNDHNANTSHLLQTAEFFAKIIQGFSCVHSVRWRVKDTEHLIEKIIRKSAQGSEKYKTINSENYWEIITDLVGVRALHLFKDDTYEIDSLLRSTWEPIEQPVAYVRSGDPSVLTDGFSSRGIEVKNHHAGYRSVHYVFSSQPTKRKIFTEIQVRTIFEEGWSEIDHRVRYPNFSDNQLVGYFLTIFNRLAGSADEMGDFVKGLAGTLGQLEEKVRHATEDKNKTLAAMEHTLGELESVKEQNLESRQNIASLKKELVKLRRANDSDSISSLQSMMRGLEPTMSAVMALKEQDLRGGNELTRAFEALESNRDLLKWAGNVK